MDIRPVSISNVWNEYKLKYLLDSAKRNNFTITILGLHKPYGGFLSKIHLLHEHLQSLPPDENPVIIFTDGFDVFYLDTLVTIYEKFISFQKQIVWSVERWYSQQLGCDHAFYNGIADNSPYRYLNSGTFMGYKNTLLKLYNDLFVSMNDPQFMSEMLHHQRDDQALLSHHIAKHWGKYDIALDYHCKIFYIPCGDWYNLEGHVQKDLKIIETGNVPSIIHVPNKPMNERTLNTLYTWKYKDVPLKHLDNTTYSWGEGYTIQFLYDNKMNTFSPGGYFIYVNPTYVIAIFCGETHNIVFNEGYTEFISIRKRDLNIVRGKFLGVN